MSNCNEFEFTSSQGTFYMDGGIRGKDGVTFYPHVSAAGILSWTNDGGKQNPDPVNIKGADGMSAYAAAQQAGFTGTEAQFNAYLSGIGTLTEDVDDLKSAVNTKAPAIYDTASGAIATFDDGADGMPIKQVVVDIEPVQEGSGDPSPTNVRPISGWTGCNIHVSPTTTGGTVYPITFPASTGTVYGGTLDVVNGLLTVDRAFIQFDENTQIAFRSYGSASAGELYPYWATFTFACNCAYNYEKWLFSHGTVGSAAMPIIFRAYKQSANVMSVVIGNDTNITNITDVKNFLQEQVANNTPLQVCYALATPIEIPLTPTQIDTLLGENNIWADCGDVSVDYPADTKLYIQKVNKPTDDDMIADTQIASGKYFLIGNTLYLSTTVIPAGDTIIPGTNCTKTNLAAALNALNT